MNASLEAPPTKSQKELQESFEDLKGAFHFTHEIPLMGFKGQFDVLLNLILQLYSYTGIGKDHAAHMAFLKLQELKEEVRVLYELHEVQSIPLSKNSGPGKTFFFVFQNIDKYMKDIIEGFEKEHVVLAMSMGEDQFKKSLQFLKHATNELHRLKLLLKELYA